MAFDQNSYINEFHKSNYDRMSVLVPKGKGAALKALAQSKGKSVSQIIIEALEAQYGLDLGKN